MQAGIVTADEVNADLKKTILPAMMADFQGLTYSFQGERAEREESFKALGKAGAIALLVIYILLAIPFGVTSTLRGDVGDPLRHRRGSAQTRCARDAADLYLDDGDLGADGRGGERLLGPR